MNNQTVVLTENSKAKRRKRRSPDEIKEKLLAAAKREFKKAGFGATSAAIATEADVTEGQLYRYFNSKQDLFRQAVFQPLNQDLSEFSAQYLSQVSLMADKKDRISLYISGLQEFIHNHSEIITVLAGAQYSGGEGLIPAKELDSLLSYFDLGTLMLESREGKNPEIAPKLMVKIIFSTVLSSAMFRDWLFPEDEADSGEVVDAIGNFLISGVYANEPVDEE